MRGANPEREGDYGRCQKGAIRVETGKGKEETPYLKSTQRYQGKTPDSRSRGGPNNMGREKMVN